MGQRAVKWVCVCVCLSVGERENVTIQIDWLNQPNNSPVRGQLTLPNWEAAFCVSEGQDAILLSAGSFWEEYKAADWGYD